MTKPVVENAYWQRDLECLPTDALHALQLQRLRETVARVAQVPFYQEQFARLGVSAESVRSLDDIRRLPFTTKADLRSRYPDGFLAVPRSQAARWHGSSGTTGKPTFVAYTHNDLSVWADLCARFLVAGGLRAHHTVQVSFGYGLFTGGFGLHYGIERLGAATIPVSSGNTERQLTVLQDMRPDALICTPSYALKLMETFEQNGIAKGSLALRFAHFGGEPWTEDMRQRIEAGLGILCFNNYGLSEVQGPGVSGECGYRCGMHIHEDCFFVEVVDPVTLNPVPDGEPGELVFTTLAREAFPIIRYRTRDIAAITREPCPCGRTSCRMGRITGRTDDMLVIRGVNVYPSQIEEALLRVDGTAPHYLIEVTRPGALDEVTIHVEMSPALFSDSMARLQQTRNRLAHAIHSVTGVGVTIDLVEPQTLDRFEGKAKRVIDRRNLSDPGRLAFSGGVTV